MKILLPKKPIEQIARDINDVIGERKILSMVSISHNSKQLVVKISKWGTSTLTFTRTDDKASAQFSLTSEDIAFTHKPFYQEVKNQFYSVVKEAGGSVIGT
jgi:hypothetical protein